MADAPGSDNPLNNFSAKSAVENKLVHMMEEQKAHDILFAECMSSETLPYARQLRQFNKPNRASDAKICEQVATDLVPQYMDQKAKVESYLQEQQGSVGKLNPNFSSSKLIPLDQKSDEREQNKWLPDPDDLVDAARPTVKEVQRLYHRLTD